MGSHRPYEGIMSDNEKADRHIFHVTRAREGDVSDRTGQEAWVQVEVAYACLTCQELLTVCVPTGTTVFEVVQYSGILERLPAREPSYLKLGIFGRIVAPETVVRERDRVEIYRPLLADPKVIRQRRAHEANASRQK